MLTMPPFQAEVPGTLIYTSEITADFANMKIQWNYVCTERDSAIDGVSDGLIHGFGM